jgi:predicted phosphodiesterase
MIGIISDSHDNMDAIRRAVEFFNKKEVKAVLHAGDLVSPYGKSL